MKKNNQTNSSTQLTLFPSYDPRFLEDHLGKILTDPSVAIIELVANAWDAYATKVDIRLPDTTSGELFSIEDNGHGMSESEFEQRWMILSYDRTKAQGQEAEKPPGLVAPPRQTFGRNGKGRHASFCYSPNEFLVETSKNGASNTYRVYIPTDREKSFACSRVSTVSSTWHGLKIHGTQLPEFQVSAEGLRAEIGMRFLSDPNFEVSVNGLRVTFDDIPVDNIISQTIEVHGVGNFELIAIDTIDADRTTKLHGVAWQVNRRRVGDISWKGFSEEKFVDGRTNEAKRFSFIVKADCLAPFVLADWQGFKPEGKVDKGVAAVNESIRSFLLDQTKEEREEIIKDIRGRNASAIVKMGPHRAELWSQFVVRVQEECSLKSKDLARVANILATMEAAHSKFGLLEKLENCSPSDIDKLNELLTLWDVETAKIVLDELQGRLQLIRKLKEKVLDKTTDEVQELQPLFDRGLWLFGPEFESIFFTSNRTINSIIANLFGKKGQVKGSKNRPDFVILPDSTVSIYACSRFDGESLEVSGIDHLAIVELKKPTVRLGSKEKEQCWKYVKELLEKGQIDDKTQVNCFLLGTTIAAHEGDIVTRGNGGHCKIRPMTYESAIRRAESRCLLLYEKVKSAPFLQKAGIDEFLSGGLGHRIESLSMISQDIQIVDDESAIVLKRKKQAKN